MIKVKILGKEAVLTGIKKGSKGITDRLDNELKAFGMDAVNKAKNNAPTDEEHLKNSIAFESEYLKVSVKVNADYAAYVEFGTRKYAAAYVTTLPPEWQQFAAQFKGGGGGDFELMVKRLTEWVHRKGLGSGFGGKIGVTGTYSVKTRRRTGGKSTQENENKQAAYAIALHILRNGIKAQPFLIPAVTDAADNLIKRLKKI